MTEAGALPALAEIAKGAPAQACDPEPTEATTEGELSCSHHKSSCAALILLPVKTISPPHGMAVSEGTMHRSNAFSGLLQGKALLSPQTWHLPELL